MATSKLSTFGHSATIYGFAKKRRWGLPNSGTWPLNSWPPLRLALLLELFPDEGATRDPFQSAVAVTLLASSRTRRQPRHVGQV